MTDTRVSASRLALVVLALCTCMNLLARGLGDTFAVFLLPLGAEHGWERAHLTGVYSTFMLVNGLSGPVVGTAFDRVGPRVLYAGGACCFGAGFVLAGRLDALWQLYLCVGVMGGVGAAAIGMVPASALVSRWFRARLGTAMGVLYAALGTGVLVIVPTTQWMIEHLGWRATYGLLGTVLLALAPLAALAPWGRLAAGHPEYAEATRRRVAREGGWTLRRALGSTAFWALFSVFFLTSVNTYAVTVQAVAYMVELGFPPLEAASAYGLAGMLSVVGMILIPSLADRIGERASATLSYTTSIVGIGALAMLAVHPSYWLVAGFVLCFGLMQGTRGPIIALAAARLFPGGGFGAIYGALTLGMGTGAAVGSWAAGLLHDLTLGYHAGFGLGAAAALAGMAHFWLVPALARMQDRPRP
ncbi:MAG: MFS transporter [Ectothiorhodospiraceae bacterium]|nr:MFS transporter [Ectothiorhodospiraceae bacterium]